jgi:hypothetical protein
MSDNFKFLSSNSLPKKCSTELCQRSLWGGNFIVKKFSAELNSFILPSLQKYNIVVEVNVGNAASNFGEIN